MPLRIAGARSCSRSGRNCQHQRIGTWLKSSDFILVDAKMWIVNIKYDAVLTVYSLLVAPRLVPRECWCF
jgi:hypothetical protein